MKTKLLKRLRKKAKDVYWIEKWGGLQPYIIKRAGMGSNDYIIAFRSLNEAKVFVKDNREGWILDLVYREKARKNRYRLDI